MQDKAAPTQYLPAERLDREQVLAIAREIARSPSAASLELMPLGVVIINNTRQIVYANERFAALAHAASIEELLGKRLGEALSCDHAAETEGGCGTTRFCRYCGAAQAIVKSLAGQRDTQECAISRSGNKTLDALNLQVWAAPMEFEARQLVLSSILDIAHEKALHGYERIFFHDIMNAVSGIRGIHDLIALELPQHHAEDLDLLRQAIENIQDIVETQKDFLSIEAREYRKLLTRIDSRDLLGFLATYCQAFNTGQAKNLRVDPEAASVIFRSDARIIQRVLINMVKNALEATNPGQTVTMGCDLDPQGKLVIWVKNPGAMSEETQAHLFEKGFSTKGAGRGFGTYGMRLFARECLEGEVDFESGPESGTCFFLRLPG